MNNPIRRTLRDLCFGGSALLCCAILASAQDNRRPLIMPEVHHDVSQPLRDLVPAHEVQTPAESPVGTTSGLNFDGVAASINNGASAPDVNGAVGATQFVQWTDAPGGEFAVYDKTTGSLLLGPAAATTLWKAFGGPCADFSSVENIAQYDKAAGRWVMTRRVYQAAPPAYQCFAVSQTSDATGTWNRYAYALSNDLIEFPKLGVWPDAYYMSFNLESFAPPHSSLGPMACAFDRNGMIAGSAANPICFTPRTTFINLLPSDLDGSTAPPTGSPNYYMNLDSNALDIWQFHVDFTNPVNSTFTGPTKLVVPAFKPACPGRGGICIPQLGTHQLLVAYGDRLMYRLAYRNFGDHESIVAAHSVEATLSKAFSVIRWYEIRSPGSSPTVFQGGTYQPDDTTRWMMSIAMDKVGDIALGYTVSSSSTYPGLSYTGRLVTDPRGTLETENSIIVSAGPQIYNSDWGTYTSMSVDPIDDCTFWYTGQYYKKQASKIWDTRIASFSFPSCQ